MKIEGGERLWVWVLATGRTYLRCFGRWGLRSRTPGPPPFSSLKLPAADAA